MLHKILLQTNYWKINFATFDENLNIRQDATPELKGLFAALRDNEKILKTQ